MVFIVHDISDVPVDLSKLTNFMKWKNATVVSFVTLLAIWLLTRLYILPFVIVKGVFEYNTCVFGTDKISEDMHYYIIAILIFKVLLIGITILHVFWFLIMIRILYRLVTKGDRHDLSEQKQGEDLDVTEIGCPDDMAKDKKAI
jgi:acyl-CoA-dependent ceramide synthase